MEDLENGREVKFCVARDRMERNRPRPWNDTAPLTEARIAFCSRTEEGTELFLHRFE